MNLLEAFKNYLFSQDKKSSKVTVKNYLSDINHFIRWYENSSLKPFSPKEVTNKSLEAYKLENAETFSASSMDRHLSSLRKFFYFLRLEGQMTIDPFKPLVPSLKSQNTDPWHIKDFKDFLYVYNASHLTIKNYLIDIKQFLAWAEEVIGAKTAIDTKDANVLNHINSDLIEEYKQRLLSQASYSPATINRKLSSLRKYIMWATDENLIRSQAEISNFQFPISNQLSPEAIQQFSEELKTKNSDLKIPDTKYSGFPPLRLAQKIAIATLFTFDNTFINPAVKFIEKADYVLWKTKGKPVFAKIKDSRLKIKELSTSSILNPKAIFGVKNIKKEFYAPLEISTKYFPWYKKTWHTLRYSRPQWYKTYHSYPIAHYFNFAILIIFIAGLTLGFYNAFGPKNQTPTLAASPVPPPRILSFQGRLTDNNDNPITSPSALRFTIYTSPTATDSGASILQWQEQDYVFPDTDGIFNIVLGNVTNIPQSVFADNSALYLGVTVGTTPELTPRQQLATVAFATNSELLQGMAPITDTRNGTLVNNTVLALDSTGNLTIGSGITGANPIFQAANGSFTISGQPLVLTTNAGSNSNTVISADGLGKISLNKPLTNTSKSNNIPSAVGSVEVDDLLSVLSSSSGQSAFTINQTGSGPLISASSSGIAKFTVDNAGNTLIAGTLTLPSSSPLAFTGTTPINISQTNGSTVNFTDGTNILASIIDAGTTGKLNVTGNYQIGGVDGVNISNNCVNATGGIITSVGTCPAAAPAYDLYWYQSAGGATGGALYPNNSTVDFLVGGQSTSSAKFGILNDALARGSQIATLSGSLTLDSTTASIQSIRNQLLTIGGNTTGNIQFSPNNTSTVAVSPNLLSVLGNITANGATGLTLSGGGADINFTGTGLNAITTASNQNFAINPGGTGFVGIGTGANTPSAFLDVNGNASIAGQLTFENTFGTIQTTRNQLLTLGGATTGNIILSPNNGIAGAAVLPSTNQNIDLGSLSLQFRNIYAQSFIGGTSGIQGYFQRNLGALSPSNITDDLLIGSVATPSAANSQYFQVFGTGTNEGSASMSGNLTLGTNGGGSIQTSRNQLLTIGGNTTGNITIAPNNGGAGSILNLNSVTTNLTGTTTLNATSLGTLNTNATLNLNGATSITNNASTLSLFNTPTTINFAQGASTALNIGPANGTLTLGNGGAYTIQTSGNSNLNLTSGGSGNIVLSAGTGVVQTNNNTVPNASGTLNLGGTAAFWANVYANNVIGAASGVQGYWQRSLLGALSPSNITDDLLIGSVATPSAANSQYFQVFGTGTNEGSASMSGNLTLGTNGGATIQTTRRQLLTLGGSTTGGIILSSDYRSGVFIGQQGTLAPLSITGGIGANAALIINQLNNADLLTASASGTTRFTVNNAGAIGLTSGYGLASQCLTSNGSAAAASWGACGTGGGAGYWTQSALGLLYPSNTGVDLAIGGTSTSSAIFTFQNVLTGTPTFSVWDSSAHNNGLSISTTATTATISATTGIINIGQGGGTLYVNTDIQNDSTNYGGYVQVSDKFLNQHTENGIALATFNQQGTGDILTASASSAPRFTVTNAGFLLPGTTATSGTQDIGSSTQQWRNLYLTGTVGGFFQRLAGNLSPVNANDTLSATSSASTVATFTSNNPTGTLTNNTLIQQTGAGNLTNGVTITQGGAGTVTNLLNLTRTAGTVTTGINLSGTIGTDLNLHNGDTISNPSAGTLSLSSSSLTASSLTTLTTSSSLTLSGATSLSTSLISITTGSSLNFAQTASGINAGASGGTLTVGNGGAYTITTSGTNTLNLNSNNGAIITGTGNISLNGSTTIATGKTLTLVNNAGNNAVLYAPSGGLVTSVASTTTANQCLLSGPSAGYVPSWQNCPGGSTSPFWNQQSGALFPNNSTVDLLIGGQSTASADFAVLGVNSASHQVTASVSGNLIVMPNNGYGGQVGINTLTPSAFLDINGTASIGGQLTFENTFGTIQTTRNQLLTLGGNTTGNITIAPNNGGAGSLLTINSQTLTLSGTTTVNASNLGTLNTNATFNINGATSITNNASSLGLFNTPATISFGQAASNNIGLGGTSGILTLGNGGAYTITTGSNQVLSINPGGSGALNLGTASNTGNVAIGNTTGSLTLNSSSIILNYPGATTFSTVSSQNMIFAPNGTGIVQTNANFIPNPTNTLNLGGTSNYWNNVYANNIIGAASGVQGYWQRTLGAISPANITDDLLLGASSTSSSALDFSVTGIAKNQPIASLSGNLIVMANKGWGGQVGIGTAAPGGSLDVRGQGIISSAADTLNPSYDNLLIGQRPAADNYGSIRISPQNSQFHGYKLEVYDPNTTANYFDIYDVTNSATRLYINSSGNVGIGTNSPVATLHVVGQYGSNAAFILNQLNNGDIFTASYSGSTKFTVSNAGAIGLASGYGTLGSCLTSGGSSAAASTWGTCGGGNSWWNQIGGVVSPSNINYDLAVGGISTSSALFSFTGIKTGQTIASASGNLIVMPNNGWGGQVGIGYNSPGTATLAVNGRVGIGTTSPLATLDIRANLTNGGTIPVASISGKTSFASLVVDNSGSGDLITASSSAFGSYPQRTQFTVTNSGLIYGRALYDLDNTAYFVDPAATATSAALLGSVGIGTSNPSAKLQVEGNVLIDGNLTGGNDYTKQTTADFTQSGYNATNVTTSGNDLSQNLATAGAIMATSAGPNLLGPVGAGANAFQRPDGKFVVIIGSGNSTNIYDPVANTFTTGPALTTNVGNDGANSIQLPNGQFLVVTAASGTTTNIYDPATNTFSAGPQLTTTALNMGGTILFYRPDGKIFIFIGGTARVTNIYDPATNTIQVGPTLLGTTNIGGGSFAIQRPDGKYILSGGNGATGTTLWDPSANTFTAGPNFSGGVAEGPAPIQRPDGKFLIFQGGTNTGTYIYDPSTNGVITGPSVGTGVEGGANTFVRPDGTYVIVPGYTNTQTKIYDPVANTISAGISLTCGPRYGGFTLQRPDGKYLVVCANGAVSTSLVDTGWTTSGSWESEQINLTGKLASGSALFWQSSDQNPTNPSVLYQKNVTFQVRTAQTADKLAGVTYQTVATSGDYIPIASQTANFAQVKILFHVPIPSNPNAAVGTIKESNTFLSRYYANYIRNFADPTVFNFTVKNPLIAKGGSGANAISWTGFSQTGTLGSGASGSGQLINLDTTNTNGLTLTFDKNANTSTGSGEVQVATTSGTLASNVAYSGSHTIQLPNGKFMTIDGSGFNTTDIYDPATNTYSAGPNLTAGVGVGGHSFMRPDGKFVTVLGNSGSTTNIYDPVNNVFTAGPSLPGNAGDGAHTVQLPNGKFLTILGGANNDTAIYDPSTNAYSQGPYFANGQTASFGSFTITLPSGKFLTFQAGGSNKTQIYDPVNNSFAAGPSAPFTLSNGANAFQRPDGKFVVIPGGGATDLFIFDPTLITSSTSYGPFTLSGLALSGAANNGSHTIQLADGKFLIISGDNSTSTSVYNPTGSTTYGNTGSITAGPTLPFKADWGAHSFQRPDGKYVLVFGNNTINTAIIDAGWALSGTYISEPIYNANLSSTTNINWKTADNNGQVFAKVKLATSLNGLGAAIWTDVPYNGGTVNASGNSFIQVRFDLQGSLTTNVGSINNLTNTWFNSLTNNLSYPGSQRNVWVSSGGGGVVAYFRSPVAPNLLSYNITQTPTNNLLTITSGGNNLFRFTADGNAFTSQNGAWYAGGADVAEYYPSNEQLQPGQIVAADPANIDSSAYVVQSTRAYQPDVLGIVSTKPGFVAGAYTENAFPIALVGRVPLLVSNLNGDIKVGDELTSSPIPGVAMKATKAGQVVGKAMQPFDSSSCSTQTVSGTATNSAAFGLIQPATQTTCQGTIVAFVNVGYFDPTPPILTDVNNLKDFTISLATNSAAIVTDAAGNVVNQAQVFAGAVIGNLNAGVANIQQLTSNNIISPLASIDTLHTGLISPIDNNSAIALKFDTNKLSILNGNTASASAVSSFDNQGNATFSGSLTANDASIAGTLRAGKIIADQIEGLNLTGSSSATYITNNVTNIYNSTPSANSNATESATNQNLAFGFPTLSASASGVNPYSYSNNFIDISSYSGQLANVGNLNAISGTFGQGLMVFGPSSLSDTSVVGQLSVNGSLILADNSINVLGSDLSLQPLRQGGLSIMGGLIYIDSDGNARFGANADFAQNVNVHGVLSANILSPIPGNNLAINLGNNQLASGSGTNNSKFVVNNASNSAILSINQLGDLIASGTATVSKLNINNLVPQALAVSPTEIVATGSAGTSAINTYQTELTIDNTLVTAKSLIYITPTSNTNNQVLFLLRQVPGVSFTVGIENPTDKPIPFNWIIVN